MEEEIMTEDLNNFLDSIKNTDFEVSKLIDAGLVFLASTIILFLVKAQIIRFLNKIGAQSENKVVKISLTEIKKIPNFLLILISLFLSLLSLDLKEQNYQVYKIIEVILYVLITIALVRFLNIALKEISKFVANEVTDKNVANAYLYIFGIARSSIWFIAILFILGNVGVEISAVLAAVGLTGVAFAFAVRKYLSDVIGSFIIILDKPFRVGDFITGKGFSGKVKSVGLKSTRIKTQYGEEIVVPNSDIVENAIENHGNKSRQKINLEIVIETKRFNPPGNLTEEMEAELKEKLKNYKIKNVKVITEKIEQEKIQYHVEFDVKINEVSTANYRAEEAINVVFTLLKKKRKKILSVSQNLDNYK